MFVSCKLLNRSPCSGLPIADAPKKISGVHKRCWKYIANLKKPEGSLDQVKEAEESTPNPDVQAA